MRKKERLLVAILVLAAAAYGGHNGRGLTVQQDESVQWTADSTSGTRDTAESTDQQADADFDWAAWTENWEEGDGAYIAVNGNVPDFEETSEEYETYADLDSLGRCGVCEACIGTGLMPTGERGAIGQVKPTGWHTAKYPGVISDLYLYNRCHLIGYQLTGENANERNLITGTRYLNMEGMLPFENEVADYVRETGNHVMYRVTPAFYGDELVARGVFMEAQSVEDDSISFNVYCPNVQPGIGIDYATGDSWEE